MTEQAKATIKARVIVAGHIPQCYPRQDRLGETRWVMPRGEGEDTPPRVLLELSEEDCKVLAARWGDEVTLEVIEP